MGQALARGLIAADVYSPREIVATDADKDRLAAFDEETGIESAGNVEAVSSATIIVLAVKPTVIVDVMEEIAGYVTADQLVISIAAGVKIQRIGSFLRSGVPIIRAMPNTPCLVQAGAIAISRGKDATDTHVERALSIFGAVGKVIEVPERLMDAVTGLSGSGPAYIYTAIESLSDAGVAAGLTRVQASMLAAQTVYGSAKMVVETGTHPAVLKEAVTSPGGTTIAGLVALERAGFRAAILDAVEAATDRSEQLSRPEPKG
jgi:pyrroline-5-carboxylate reductase